MVLPVASLLATVDKTSITMTVVRHGSPSQMIGGRARLGIHGKPNTLVKPRFEASPISGAISLL